MLLRRLGASGRFEVLDSSDAEWLLGLAAVEGRETEVTWAILGSSKLYAGLVKLNTSNTIVCLLLLVFSFSYQYSLLRFDVMK